jgi:hypothetical protein
MMCRLQISKSVLFNHSDRSNSYLWITVILNNDHKHWFCQVTRYGYGLTYLGKRGVVKRLELRFEREGT